MNTKRAVPILLAGAALAVSARPAQAATTTADFTDTVAAHQFTVPPGVTKLFITARGAQGGTGAPDLGSVGGPGGHGAGVTGALAVTPGEVLKIYVGGRGGDPTSPHAGVGGSSGDLGGGERPVGGGGGPGETGPKFAGGGGGGATVVAGPSGVLLAAGGGGGGGGGGAGGGGGGGCAHAIINRANATPSPLMSTIPVRP
jgi:hypothetical protein